jgi:uncharacterized protein
MSSRERDIECRSIPFAVELRSGHGGRSIGGWAVVFNTRSKPLPGGFIEIAENCCLNKSRADGWPNVVCRAEHSDVLGSVRGGTLQLDLSSTGLDYECDVAETRAGDDILALTRRGDLAGSSFAMNVFEDEWANDGGVLVRHLISVRLLDVSPVAIPAYDASTISLRSLAAQCDAPLTDVEALASSDQLLRLVARSDMRSPVPQEKPRKKKALTVQQRLMELYKTPKTGAVQQGTLTPAKMRKQLTDMRLPKPPKSAAERRAELTRMAKPMYETAASIGLDA